MSRLFVSGSDDNGTLKWGIFYKDSKGEIKAHCEDFEPLSFDSEEEAASKLESIEKERAREDSALPFDLPEARKFAEDHKWKFAVTYAETAPHEYLVKKWLSEEDKLLFEKFVANIKRDSVTGYFYGHKNSYLILGDYYYWIMPGHERAIHTLNHVLDEMDRNWLPVIKTYKLNERHYGALQGLNKSETAAKYGEEQVKIWRRSFDVKPPALDPSDERAPVNQAMFRNIPAEELPLNESLETTIERVVPYFESVIKKDMAEGKRVLIAAHGNSLRALVKYFDNLSDDEIIGVNIPTGSPLVYEFDDNFNVTDHYYLGMSDDELKARMAAVANQGAAK